VSKADKLLRRLFRAPAPKDFAWEELLTVMSRAGFVHDCQGGSHFMFEHSGGFRFSMSRTHPSGILKLYQIRDAKSALLAVGVTGED
jgi:predicted RNA binding protein YcfA (HicA-like mRNA interferase family)